MNDCAHHWTVTSECPRCLRILLDNAIARAERAEHRADMAERGLAAGWQTLTAERDALRRLCAKAQEALKRSLGGYSEEELSRWRAQYIAGGDNGSKMAGWLLAIEALDEAEKSW